MATGTIMPSPVFTGFDSNGDPLSGGLLYTYVAGTTTAQTTYSDVGLTTANANPVALSSAGRATVYLPPGQSFKFVLKTSAGATVWTTDNVSSIPTSTADLEVSGLAGEVITDRDVCYLSDGAGSRTAGRWYKVDADLDYASSLATLIGVATSDMTTGEAGAFRLGGSVDGYSGLTAGAAYYASATAGGITATAPTRKRAVAVAQSTTTIVLQPNAVPLETGVCDGRLTLTSGTPVTSSDVTVAGTIYFTPYRGNRVSLYNGTSWITYAFSERSLALTATSGKNYDVFLYDNAGVLTLELSAAWTTDTTRADALTTQDGVVVKSGSTTRRYLGTIRASGSNVTEDSYAKRFVWNHAHRAGRVLRVAEASNSWTYTTDTWRQMNGATTNQVEVVTGQVEDAIAVTTSVTGRNIGNGIHSNAIGEDSTSSPHAACFRGMNTSGNYAPMTAHLGTVVPLGYHYYAALEISQATSTTTWFGDDGGSRGLAGIVASWRA